jgi:hypothetical protein
MKFCRYKKVKEAAIGNIYLHTELIGKVKSNEDECHNLFSSTSHICSDCRLEEILS